MAAIDYELAIDEDGEIRISVYTSDPDVALEINERLEEIVQRTLDSIGREKAEDRQ